MQHAGPGTAARMPSYSLHRFAGLDLDDIMCKQLLSLDLRDVDNRLSPIGGGKAAPGFVGQQRGCDTSLSLGALTRLDAGPPDDGLWGPQPEGRQAPGQWRKRDFLSQRSLSMVESGTAPESPGWPGSDVMMMLMMKSGQEGAGPASAAPSSSSSASSRYKTELCRSFTESGTCKYGGKCQFAHGPDELRDLSRHPKYKTEPCRTFHTIGFCPYGIRCHFVHNNEEEMDHLSRSSSFALQSRANRIPLMRQSVSFSGFPTPPQHYLPPAAASFARAQSASPPCADITDLLAQVFSETEPSTLQASAAPQYQPVSAADPRSPFLPSPDSGCSPSGPSPPPSPGVPPLFSRSLSYASLSDQDQDEGSSASSLSGLESGSEGKRLAVFSQLSVPEDGAGSGL
ncbi:mRNA decay activator protein ZFP36 [Nerophis ophidion]|uniref:mRNA decay activator protein ZFP36 n=1 Tax=Nerophis ophidion TaxID=159077 RepID=UPI002AE07FF8|nr:mRNA decay activator protein ZFP36 [Nerophis ophidion]